jgi:hypothetical protein
MLFEAENQRLKRNSLDTLKLWFKARSLHHPACRGGTREHAMLLELGVQARKTDTRGYKFYIHPRGRSFEAEVEHDDTRTVT